MHSISPGQHRFRPTEDLTQPTGLRKGFLEEGTPQPSWDKGKIRGGYSRAREPQGIWFWPLRAARPGWAELEPQAAESWASLRRKLPEPNSPEQRDPQAWAVVPGKAVLSNP